MTTVLSPKVLVDPTVTTVGASATMAPRPESLDGMVIGLLNNGKRNADLFLDATYQPAAQVLQVPEHLGWLDVVDRRFISMARAHNMKVCVWTVDETEDMRRLLRLGVDGVNTSHPDRLLGMLGAMHGGNDE